MKFNLDIPKMGYFIVYKRQEGFHPLEHLIYKEQINEGFSKEDSEYTHVETIIAGNETINHSFPIARRKKFAKKSKGRYIKIVAYNDENYNVLRYKVSTFAASLNNTFYNIFSLLWFKINDKIFKKNNVLASRHTPFCSFGCAWALKKVFSESFDNSSIVMPADFLNKAKFIVIWEGYIE
ncbi:MAG: hypothetical protein ACTSYR_03385 [Candidatus Odinarchaeia archaeon]